MAVDDVRQRVRGKLEQLLGAEEASWLMDRPPGGWTDLVTNQTLDAKLSALDAKLSAVENRLLAEIDRRFKVQTWYLVSALITGLGVFGVLVR
jgi:hypothetical protein